MRDAMVYGIPSHEVVSKQQGGFMITYNNCGGM